MIKQVSFQQNPSSGDIPWTPGRLTVSVSPAGIIGSFTLSARTSTSYVILGLLLSQAAKLIEGGPGFVWDCSRVHFCPVRLIVDSDQSLVREAGLPRSDHYRSIHSVCFFLLCNPSFSYEWIVRSEREQKASVLLCWTFVPSSEGELEQKISCLAQTTVDSQLFRLRCYIVSKSHKKNMQCDGYVELANAKLQ